jgi:hypothetical protein
MPRNKNGLKLIGLDKHRLNTPGRESFSGHDEHSRLSLRESKCFRGAKDDIHSQNAQMEKTFSENDSRPPPQNATAIHLPVLRTHGKAGARMRELGRGGSQAGSLRYG